jgi:hypothetical protein
VPANTPNLNLPYPVLGDAPNGPQQMQDLAAKVDTLIGGVVVCTSATRPTAREGATIYETDTDRYVSYNGSAWLVLGQMVTSSYTPTLTAATTNPTAGTSAVTSARYTLFGGKWCTVRGTIRFGTSGVSAGSGQYLISLPVATATTLGAGVDAVGAGLVFDSSSTNVVQAIFYVAGSGSSNMAGFANGAQITNAAPWVWAASDYLSFTLTYETA